MAITLAAYHSGIERDIFLSSPLCNSLVNNNHSNDISLEEFEEFIYSSPLGSCSKPALLIFRLSLTEWNLCLNILLLLMVIISLFKKNNAKTLFPQS